MPVFYDKFFSAFIGLGCKSKTDNKQITKNNNKKLRKSPQEFCLIPLSIHLLFRVIEPAVGQPCWKGETSGEWVQSRTDMIGQTKPQTPNLIGPLAHAVIFKLS